MFFAERFSSMVPYGIILLVLQERTSSKKILAAIHLSTYLISFFIVLEPRFYFTKIHICLRCVVQSSIALYKFNIDLIGKSLSKQMESASDSNYSIIVGPKEYEEDSILLRNMKDGSENKIHIKNLLADKALSLRARLFGSIISLPSESFYKKDAMPHRPGS